MTLPSNPLDETLARRERAIEKIEDALRSGTMLPREAATLLIHEHGFASQDAWALVHEIGAEADYVARVP